VGTVDHRSHQCVAGRVSIQTCHESAVELDELDRKSAQSAPSRPPNVLVNNVRGSMGAGPRADDYWDNPTFCQNAAEILKPMATLEVPLSSRGTVRPIPGSLVNTPLDHNSGPG
jgi:hypothetical protein